MDMLYNNMSLPDLIDWAGIETVKQVMVKYLTDERIWKNAKIVPFLIIKLGQIIRVKQKRTWQW